MKKLVRSGQAALIVFLFAIAINFNVMAENEKKGKGEKDEIITQEQLPDAVKDAVKNELAGKQIKEIEKETEDGKTVYEIEVMDGDNEKEYVYSEDGKLLKEDDDDDDAKTEEKEEDDDDDEEEISLSKVPDAVKKTAEKFLGSLKDAEAEKEKINGEEVFEIVIEKKDKEISLFIKENGDAVQIAKEIKVSSLPPSIMNKIKEKYPEAKIKEAEEIHKIENGIEKPEASYEVEIIVKKDILITSDGQISESAE